MQHCKYVYAYSLWYDKFVGLTGKLTTCQFLCLTAAV